MLRPALLLIIAISIAACDATETRCSSPADRELRTVEKLISETQANIDRGYTTERTNSGFNFCLGGAGTNVGVSFCNDLGGKRAAPVDKAAEQRKLDALLKRRDALRQQAANDQALCGAGGA